MKREFDRDFFWRVQAAQIYGSNAHFKFSLSVTQSINRLERIGLTEL